jgi:hypothetical protein
VKKHGGENNTENIRDLLGPYRDRREPYFGEDWWVDMVEGEVDPNLEEDLSLLLKNSSSDRKIVESLEKTRHAIKKSDDVPMPESGQYYTDLHDRIMASINEVAPSAPSLAAPKGRHSETLKKSFTGAKFAWPSLFGALSLSVMVAFISWFGLKTGLTQSKSIDSAASMALEPKPEPMTAGDSVERGLASVGDVVPSFSKSMVGFENESDLVAQVAAERLNGLSNEQLNRVLETLKN